MRNGITKRTLAAVLVATAGAGFGAAQLHGGAPAPRPCHVAGHALATGATISVDRSGNASTPAAGGLELVCADGTWVRISSHGSAS